MIRWRDLSHEQKMAAGQRMVERVKGISARSQPGTGEYKRVRSGSTTRIGLGNMTDLCPNTVARV